MVTTAKVGAVMGGNNATDGYGVQGVCGRASGLNSPLRGTGVWGDSTDGYGVVGSSESFVGVLAWSATGLAFRAAGNAQVDESLTVNGDVILSGEDCAEHFDVVDSADVDPGTVLVVTATGALAPSTTSYDPAVAGIVSGAGGVRPGLVLGQTRSTAGRAPVALSGKVFCKVDANFCSICVGDLLTTSPTRGHAMKALDRALAFGAVIGKALRPLAEGQGMIPVLVALQ
jgi:hypothetical protein